MGKIVDFNEYKNSINAKLNKIVTTNNIPIDTAEHLEELLSIIADDYHLPNVVANVLDCIKEKTEKDV